MFTVLLNGGAMPFLILHFNLREPDGPAGHPLGGLEPDTDSLLRGFDNISDDASLLGTGHGSRPKSLPGGLPKSKLYVLLFCAVQCLCFSRYIDKLTLIIIYLLLSKIVSIGLQNLYTPV